MKNNLLPTSDNRVSTSTSPPTTNSTTSNNTASNPTSSNASYLITSDGTKVSFIVENTLKEAKSYSNETYRCFDKTIQEDTSSIYIKESYESTTQYWETVSSKVTNLTSSGNDSNVQLSNPRTLTVKIKPLLAK